KQVFCTSFLQHKCVFLKFSEPQTEQDFMEEKSVYDFFAESLDGQQIPLSTFRNKVLLIVNVATF
uniref:Glutathione peroxidase n=1 Tax=Oryzias melastigma TaxID=30732 RepID=A0A3B3BYC5_ORYME